MNRYLIETPHTEQNCRNLVHLVNAAGYLNHFDWGCLGGVHCGWAIIEAENGLQARLAVPPLVRSEARVVEIVKFARSMPGSKKKCSLTRRPDRRVSNTGWAVVMNMAYLYLKLQCQPSSSTTWNG